MGMLLGRIEHVAMGSRIAGEVDMAVGMSALGEMVIVQRAHDWQDHGEQRHGQEDRPDQRRRFGREMPGMVTGGLRADSHGKRGHVVDSGSSITDNGGNSANTYRSYKMASQDIALMAHLMRRAGFGATRDELEERAAKGYEATVEELLNPESQPAIDRYELIRFQPWTWRPGTIQGMGSAEWLHFMINTKRPLEEKMALFWHQIFATGVSKVDHYDEITRMVTLFREKGMGNYKESAARGCQESGDDLLAGQLRKPC